MSARNGDKSRFNRERKEKIARRKRIHELLGPTAKARKSADTTARVDDRRNKLVIASQRDPTKPRSK